MITIGQRDIEFYRACVEQEQTRLRRCAVDQEARIQRRLSAARAVVEALETYNSLLERGEKDGQEKR
jgi:hypothetical protein